MKLLSANHDLAMKVYHKGYSVSNFTNKILLILYLELLSASLDPSLHAGQNTKHRFWNLSLPQIIAQEAAARGMAQLAQSFGFNLADPLTGYIKVLSHFFERMILTIQQTKAHL